MKIGLLGVLLRKDYSVIITFQLDVISSKFVDSHLRCKGSRIYQQQDLRFCTNTQEAFVFLDNIHQHHINTHKLGSEGVLGTVLGIILGDMKALRKFQVLMRSLRWRCWSEGAE